MAEALGVAASILQIVSTGVQVSLYLYNYAETVSSAGKALKEISDDITFTTSVLEQLKTTLESEKHYGTASKEALSTADILVRECSNVFEAIMALVKKHFPEPRKGQRSSSRLNNLKWPFIQPKIENLRSKLEKHKTKLILMTQVLTFAKIAASEQRNIDNQIEQERQKLEALLIVSHRAKAKAVYSFNPIGLTEVFSPSVQASVDVVFVHGIFGHPKDTWTCDDADIFWPAELLPPILEDESTRVLTYGYDAGADTFVDGQAGHKINDVVGSLARDLVSNRQIRKATERPLVFVAYSFGGLVVKGVLAHSSKHKDDATSNLRSISISTYGIVFLSTPHNILPSHIDLICDMAMQRSLSEVSETIDRLKAKHSVLHRLNKEFLDLAHRYQLCCFREMLEPKILDDLSARLSMLHEEATGIQSNHYKMSKFSSNHSPGFDLVCAAIQTYVYSAPKYIRSRWTEERPKEKLQNNVPSITTIRPKTTRYSALGCLPYVDEFSRTETPHTTNQLSRDRPGMLLSVTKELGDSYCNPRDLQLNPAYEFSSTSGIPGGPVPNPPHVLGHEGIHSMRDGETIGMHASVDNVHDTSDRSQAILRSNTIEHSGLDVLRSTTSNQKTHHKQGPASSSSSRTDGGNRVFNTLSRSAVHVVSPAEDNMLAEKPQGILQESQDNHKYTKEPILLDYGIAPLEYSRLSFFSESYPSTGIHPSQQPPMARERARPSSRGSVDNYAPRDHQMQLMLLEQQSKKRALIARQEQASLSSGVEPVVPSQFSTVPPHFMKDEEHTPGDTTLDLALVQQTQQEQRMPQVMQMEPQRRMQRREQFIITPQMRTHSALLETSSSWPSKRAAMCMPKDAEPTAERLNGADTKSTELIAGQPTIEAKQDSAFSSNAIYADFLPSSNISFNTTDEGDVLDHFDFVSFFEDSYGERDRGNLEPFQRELKCNTASLQRWNVDRGHREGYGAPESGTAPLWAAADSGRDNNGYGQQNVGVTPWQQQAAPPPLGGYGNYQGYGNDNEYATSKGIPPELAVLDLGARATLNILLQSKVNNDHEAKSYGDPIPPDELVMFSPSISVLNKPNTLCTNVENNTDRPALMYMATPNRNRGSTSPLDEMGRKISMKRAAKPAQGDAGLVNKMANNQYPHLVLENSPQKVSPSYESVSDEGEVSYGKRKRGQEMQDVESVVSSELQVQNEQRSIPELSTEVQARGKPMGFSGNFSKMRDCSIPTMLSPSRTDFDPETYRLSHTRTTLLRAEATKGPEKSQNAASWREPSKMMIENLQGLDATEAEISRAKEEIFKLLRQWTTCDSSTWTDGTIQVM